MAEEEQQPQQKQIPWMPPINTYGGSIITMTDPSDELHQMELVFRNAIELENGELKILGEPLMNEVGITRIVGMVRSIVNRVTIMSDLNKQDVPALINFLGDTLSRDLMVNRVAYEIGKTTTDGVKYYDPSARDTVFFNSLTTAYICMKRAFEGGDRRFWKGSQQEIRHTTVQEGTKKSLLSKLNPWKT